MRFEDLPDLPDHFYRNNLPHFDPKDAPYFVTYRLHGSIPKSELGKLAEQFRSAKTEADHAQAFGAYDAVLHRNGPCHLQNDSIRRIVMDSLHHLNESEIRLYAYSIMPNHVHAVFDLLNQRNLFEVMQSHKSFTARRANVILDRTGQPFWKRETFDHVIREGRLGSAIWYTILNPVKAGLAVQWEDWPGTYLAPGVYGYRKDPRAEFSRKA